MIAILAGVFLLMNGSKESIAGAPAQLIASYPPKYLAIKGISKIDKSSLKTLDKKASVPRLLLILASSIAEKEYHPIPELIAIVSEDERFKKKEEINPPKRDPNITVIGRKITFFLIFFRVSLNSL